MRITHEIFFSIKSLDSLWNGHDFVLINFDKNELEMFQKKFWDINILRTISPLVIFVLFVIFLICSLYIFLKKILLQFFENNSDNNWWRNEILKKYKKTKKLFLTYDWLKKKPIPTNFKVVKVTYYLLGKRLNMLFLMYYAKKSLIHRIKIKYVYTFVEYFVDTKNF